MRARCPETRDRKAALKESPARPRPIYWLAPASERLPAGFRIDGREPLALASASDLEGKAGGVLLLHASLPGEELAAALRIVWAAPSAWLPALLDGTDARPISLGWPAEPAELGRWAAGSADANVWELRHVLARVARARHDLNNPLTSAMAETQLALMLEVKDPELRTGLETLEEQLRRMRDLIASLKSLRPPE